MKVTDVLTHSTAVVFHVGLQLLVALALIATSSGREAISLVRVLSDQTHGYESLNGFGPIFKVEEQRFSGIASLAYIGVLMGVDYKHVARVLSTLDDQNASTNCDELIAQGDIFSLSTFCVNDLDWNNLPESHQLPCITWTLDFGYVVVLYRTESSIRIFSPHSGRYLWVEKGDFVKKWDRTIVAAYHCYECTAGPSSEVVEAGSI